MDAILNKITIPTIREIQFNSRDILYCQIEAVTSNLHNQFEDVVMSCLKTKGFEFENRHEFHDFVKNHCRMEIYQATSERILYVDNIPFCKWVYNSAIDMKIKIEGNTMSATYGSFCCL